MTTHPPSFKPLLHGLTHADLLQACVDLDLPSFRAEQIRRWLFVQEVSDWSAMTNLSAADRDLLSDRFDIVPATLACEEQEESGTRKLLVNLRDGEQVESVLIPAGDRRTVCISSQVGCQYACVFCASGQAGYRRNLEAGEMVGQVLLASRVWGQKPSHVVFMGMGEPLDNVDAVIASARIINDPDGVGIGARRITISTSGVIPGMERLSREGMQFELSVSLHTADDALRSSLMPINQTYPLADVVRACRAYTAATKRIVTFEYTLIRNVNDSEEMARDLVRLVEGLSCRVNLIPLSEVKEYKGRSSEMDVARAFAAILETAGVNTTLRLSKGSRIHAACGQLRAHHTG